MRRDLLIGLLLAALTLGVYWSVRTHDFILYDDPEFITQNLQIQSGLNWSTMKYAFTEPVVGNWHPVTTLSHAVDCELFGVRPGAHHLVNALIHSANAALLFLLLRQFVNAGRFRPAKSVSARTPKSSGQADATGQEGLATRVACPSEGVWLTALVALLFGLHPLRVESVAWIAERKDVLSGLFFLLSLWMYARYARTERSQAHENEKAARHGSRAKFYLGALFCFALGLMSKPMVVTLPFVLLLMDFWPLRRFEISNWKSQISNLKSQTPNLRFQI